MGSNYLTIISTEKSLPYFYMIEKVINVIFGIFLPFKKKIRGTYDFLSYIILPYRKFCVILQPIKKTTL